ncbi:orexin receptor type 2 [Octopus bimaculoides]|uniref:orexin receptor type 2 n=1 Tax=Octopus bimaculoides TaxID=37653 RepID=UPI00071CAD9E|nr:orexin receptor type 2 [Octopus bimaculoides]|eukprot:XP_014772081.1 PREDICTED: orexin receptor type 2-like [Octopus bimaculoides]
MEQNKSINECVISVEKLNADIVNAYLPIIMFLTISMIIGGTGNFFVTYIYYHKFYPNATKLFIVTLSICDFLICIVCIPMELIVLYYSYIFESDVACRAIRFCVCLAIITSALIVFSIAIDRYLLICKPLKKKISIRKAKKILTVLITISFILSIPTLFLYGQQIRMIRQCGNIAKDCSISSNVIDTVYPVIYHIILATACYSLFIFILVVYILIGKSIWNTYTAKNFKRSSIFDISITTEPSTQNEGMSTDICPIKRSFSLVSVKRASMNPVRTSFILLTITLVWMVTYLPHFAGAFLKVSTKNFTNITSHKDHAIYKSLLYSFYLSSAINPLLYGLFSKRFRKEMRLLFKTLFSRGTQ